jgi:hypothetical protein
MYQKHDYGNNFLKHNAVLKTNPNQNKSRGNSIISKNNYSSHNLLLSELKGI